MILIALAALAAAEPAPPEDAAATLKAAQAMYDQSCQVRAYGSYDDLCDALRKQLREAARSAQKAPKAKASAPPAGPKPTDIGSQPTVATQASAAP